jgi:hypothetical protein
LRRRVLCADDHVVLATDADNRGHVTDSTHAIAQTAVNRMLPPLCATLTTNPTVLATGVANRVNAAVQTHADDQTAANRELPHQHAIPTANHAVPAIGAIT